MIGKMWRLAGLFVRVWRVEGWRAVRRVPGRLKREFQEFLGRKGATVRARESGIQNMVPQSAVAVLTVDLSSVEGVAEINRAASHAGAEWLFLVPATCTLDKDAMFYLRCMIGENPHCDIIYADEVAADSIAVRPYPHLKPAFSPEMLLAYNYIGFPVAIRRSVFEELGGFQPELESGADHDLWLRAWASGKQFWHVSKVMIYGQRRPRTSTQRASVVEVVSSFCNRYRPELEARPGLTNGTAQVRMTFEEYPVLTLVVPTNQSMFGQIPHITLFLESLSKSTWPMDRLRVVVGDDCENGDAYANREWPFELRRIYTDRNEGETFNYSRKMNRLLREVDSEAVVLINDDVRVRSPDWLEAMLTFSLDSDVGAVGARLLFPDGRLQHAGVVGGLYGNVAHAWFGDNSDQQTYQDWALVHRNWSMVTGAVLATRMSVLESVGGFDEGFALEYNDLDLCLRMAVLGYRIVYTPFAELYHFEKSSRGNKEAAGHEMARFRLRWREVIDDDPYYHPGLSRNSYRVEVA